MLLYKSLFYNSKDFLGLGSASYYSLKNLSSWTNIINKTLVPYLSDIFILLEFCTELNIYHHPFDVDLLLNNGSSEVGSVEIFNYLISEGISLSWNLWLVRFKHWWNDDFILLLLLFNVVGLCVFHLLLLALIF